ncbi:2-phosphosulfolactate phosphatase [Brevibacillus daliensis]|uniref:2-phosphosulfolactate phosphatase n=1 Tax=Brevibacillus daliensis TaxID=2892995 RepID=UPI001E4D3D1C|nr:2-phosphosulfolactate phosphatase [Brevibacillus daliensis]
MRIESVSTVDEIRQEQITHRTVIIIDVLRSTSTIVSALAHGCKAVTPTETIGQALQLRRADTWVAGERHSKKIPEFDETNSPVSMSHLNWSIKNHLILTTTNGTRAMQKAERAEHLLIGSFLNAHACIHHAIQLKRDITLYCAGTRQEFALEDGLCAGYMIHYAKKTCQVVNVCDLSLILEAAYLACKDSVEEMLFTSTTGKRLVKHQAQADVTYAARLNPFKIVPVQKEKRILPLLGS